MLAAAFLSCVSSSGSCITSSRKPITRIFNSVFSSKSWGSTNEQPQCHYWSVMSFFVVVFLSCEGTERQNQTRKRKKRGLHLRMFGDPVTQHIQDSVCGSSSDNKLFVPISLVCRETWNKKWTPKAQTCVIYHQYFMIFLLKSPGGSYYCLNCLGAP